MSDNSDFEGRVRVMLRTRATDIEGPVRPELGPAGAIAGSDARRGPLRRRMTVLAAAAVIVTVVLLRVTDDHEVTTVPADEPGVAPNLPPPFDPTTAPAIFSAGGDVEAVVDAYLGARFPDFAIGGVAAHDFRIDGELASANWLTSDDGGPMYGGAIFLRRDGGAWGVTGATTNGIDLSGIVNDGQRVHGTIASLAIDHLAADVLDLDGQPVPDAPRPGGMPLAAYRVGTAGESDSGVLNVDIPVEYQTVVLRVQLVGGTLLSIAEVALVPPAPAPAGVAVWPNEPTTRPRSDPATTARSFAEEVVGQVPTSVETDSEAPAGGPTWVDVDFGATRVRILTAPTDGGWVVIQVGDARLTTSADPHTAFLQAVAGAVEVEVRIDTVAGVTTVIVAADQLEAGVAVPGTVSELRSIVAVYRDGQGRVVGVTGGHFGPVGVPG